jgi:3-oxoacyl-[acyl-carrier-protein] synthase III
MKEISLQILGTGEFAPSHRVDSTEFDRIFNRGAGWTFEQTGVRSRAFARDGESVVSMGASAAREALSNAGLAEHDLDLIVAVGSVPAQAIPCTAVLLHRELGLSGSGTAAFDVNATCLGFLAALDLVAQGIATERYKAVLMVASERPSVGLRQTDFSTAGLFGDGAGAIIVGPGNGKHGALLASHFQTFSHGAEFCRVRAGGSDINPHKDPAAYLDGSYFEMRGRHMYRLAAERMPAFLDTLLARARMGRSDVDVWVPHQASAHGVNHMRQALGLPAERFVSTIETRGNQVAASLPVALHHGIQSGRIKSGATIALIGTGAGLSFGGALLRY